MNDINSADFWETLYQRGADGWSLDGPTPVFRALVEQKQIEPGRMIVLGAGHGYDARLFARHDFQVTAVDFAHAAVRAMHELATDDAPVAIVQADLFDLPSFFTELFDYVLEYVCFCAIDPSRRAEYADVVASLLKPGGHYIALAFPIGDRQGGPPFAVDPDELIRLLEERRFVLEHQRWPSESIKPRRGREQLLILRKQENGSAG